MKHLIILTAFILSIWFPVSGQSQQKPDWLLNSSNYNAKISQSGEDIVLNNGLVRRVFKVKPNVACIDYVNLTNGQQLLRSIKPEARLTINGKDYNVGGLYGQKENAYLRTEWLNQMTVNKNDFQFVKSEIDTIKPLVKWKNKFWTSNGKRPSGKKISFYYRAGANELSGLEVVVNYELYNGIPLIVKSLTIKNSGSKLFKIDRVVNEILGMVEEQSAVVGSPDQMAKPQGIYFESNYAFNNAMRYDLSDQTTHWKVDSTYTSQVNYNYQTPCLLEIYPDKAPGIEIKAGEDFNSIRTYELLMDSYDRERRGLSIRRMYQTVAPWTNSNPIFMHLVSRNDEQVMTAIDQCAATGYEALILSFGSHCNTEDTTEANISKWRKIAEYAHQKKVFIGTYTLFSSRKISDEDDVIDPKTGKPGRALKKSQLFNET